jgi:Gpi18-like mannosyltransferase
MHQNLNREATAAFCLSAVIISFAVFLFFRHTLTNDISQYNLPWLIQIEEHGVLGLSGEYSNYTPTYLYLLAIFAPLNHFFANVTLIKLIPFAFTFVAAIIIYLIILRINENKRLAAIAGSGFLLLPTVVMNGSYWGQSDIIYTTFVLSFLLYTLVGRPAKACIFIGIAFTFKLQTIFVAPYVLYLILRRRMFLHHLTLIPVIYVIAMLPAWLLGRPADELALIYLNQAQQYKQLSMSAPNYYSIVQRLHLVDFNSGMLIGISLATVVGFILAVAPLRLRDNQKTMTLVLTASVILMPFLLPKMHDRYFFLADVLTYVLAFITRAWALAVGMQIGSLTAYWASLFGHSDDGPPWSPYYEFLGWHIGAELGALAVTVAAFGIVWILFFHRIPREMQRPDTRERRVR